MLIRHLRVASRDLIAQRRLYAETLGFAIVSETDDALTVQTGASRLSFVAERVIGAVHGPYHFAFNIPFDQVDEAKSWVVTRVPLVVDRAGESDFHNERFASHQFYFKDADGNIGEFIGRRRQPASQGAPFEAATCVRNISEIGVAVPDVAAAFQRFTQQFGPSRYGVNADGVFAGVGDDDGMLIVVRDGRLWFPDTGIPANPLWFEADLQTERGAWRLTGPDSGIARIDAATSAS